MYLKSIRKWFTLPAKSEIQLMRNWIMKRVSCSKSLLTTAHVFFSSQCWPTNYIIYLPDVSNERWKKKHQQFDCPNCQLYMLNQLRAFLYSNWNCPYLRFVVCDVQVNHAEHTNAELKDINFKCVYNDSLISV